MKTNTKWLLIVGGLTILMVTFLIGTKSYFNNKEINLASEKCFERDGNPVVDMDSLALNYSFSCDEN